MCLLFLVPARSEREAVSDAWLTDIYKRNDDGFGFMWHTKRGGNKHYKAVGDAKAFIRAYREMERHSKSFAVHVRMATHGAVEASQSHPYPVDEEGKVWLMHNGILSRGNYDDVAKSDTWHYVDSVVRPLFNSLGDGLFTPELLEMMGEAIGNNRFILLDPQGDFHVVNQDDGLTWKNMWLSNTYAWPAVKYGAEKPRKSWGGGSAGTLYDDDWSWGRGSVTNADKADDGVTRYPARVPSLRSTYLAAGEWLEEIAETSMAGLADLVQQWEVAFAMNRSDQSKYIVEAILDFADELGLTNEDAAEFILKGTFNGAEPDPVLWGNVYDEVDAAVYEYEEEEELDERTSTIDADAALVAEINEAMGERPLVH